ncbi:MAG: heme biosynthesis HemY N-terminal domain-containing protein [Micavibrio sp.]
MLRALWFFIQIAIVVCAALWLIGQRGAVDIAWNNYEITLQLGIFLLLLAFFAFFSAIFFKFAGMVVGAPGAYTKRRVERNRKKGFQALTRGFVAIAAGDARKATSYARDVRRLLPDETGLPLLLEAQSARLRGEEGAARKSFEKLLGDKDAAFFGIRGLLKSSLDAGNVQEALTHANAALEKNPKQPWIIKSVYDLELQNHHWHAAYKTLAQARKYKAVDEEQARKDEIALLMILAEEDSIAGLEKGRFKKLERVLKLDPAFSPAIVKLGENYLARKKNRKVAALVERAWKMRPHPDLVALWDKLAPEDKASDNFRRLRWIEKLVDFKPDSAQAHLAAAKAAMEAGLFGEARAHVTMAESIRPSASVYRLYADLEEQTSRDASRTREWMEKAASAPPDFVWYCSLTGAIYERWSPVAEPHGSFNTIEWGNPSARTRLASNDQAFLSSWKDPLMVEKL